MSKMVIVISSFVLALLCSGPLHACSVVFSSNWRDKPISIMPDGSFDHAEEDQGYGMGGRVPIDIGNGKVGQRLVYSDPSCSFPERLLVVDCTSLDGIVIDGLVDFDEPGLGGGNSYSVDLLYPPKGKIRLTKSVTIGELAAVSRAEDYDFTTDLQAAFATKKKKNRYNPFNACKIFYPDSPGAKTK
jgi:hypothetical protein